VSLWRRFLFIYLFSYFTRDKSGASLAAETRKKMLRHYFVKGTKMAALFHAYICTGYFCQTYSLLHVLRVIYWVRYLELKHWRCRYMHSRQYVVIHCDVGHGTLIRNSTAIPFGPYQFQGCRPQASLGSVWNKDTIRVISVVTFVNQFL
jgi:hypothetical protein